MRIAVKNFIFSHPFLINYLPFNNKHLYSRGVHVSSEGELMINCSFNSHGKNNQVILKQSSMVRNCHFNFYGDNNTVVIGEKTTVINSTFHSENDCNRIIIGKGTKVCGKTEFACMENTEILIGDNCLLSSEIFFRTGDSHSVIDMNGKRINPSKSITICNHVWIGQGVKITKGVTVPNDCIIGIGSIVTRKFEKPNTAIAGNPARIIKENINWDVKRIEILGG